MSGNNNMNSIPPNTFTSHNVRKLSVEIFIFCTEGPFNGILITSLQTSVPSSGYDQEHVCFCDGSL